MALLAFANVSEARSLQDDTDKTTEETSAGTDGENAEDGAATECKEDEECPEANEDGDGEVAAEEEEEEKEPERAKNEPGGKPWRPHQNIFTQGAWNWDGAAIHKAFTEKQISEATRDEDSKVNMAYDEKVNIDVGRLDGQTGWTGINQAGEKTMSY